jgi:hypothetical protein
VFLIAPFGINPLLKLIESFCVSPTVISFGCTKVKNCVFFPEFGAGVTTDVGVGVTTGVGVGVGVTTRDGVGIGVITGAGVAPGAAATTRIKILKLLAWYLSVSSVKTTKLQFPTFLNSTTYKGMREQLLVEPIAKR